MEIKRQEAIILNRLLSDKKIGKVSKDGAFALLDNKIELTKSVKELEEAQKIAAEECKPEAMKGENAVETEELKEEWNRSYGEYMARYMSETVEVDLKPLTRDDFMTLVQENDLSIEEAEFLTMIRHD